ncbi:MAG TPA: lysine--tRNA ligase [Candidatus Acidoferrales bacterium]|nr:lysine--tRNA ligase [Candidatus Acidoferrales bacterium]
MANAKVEIIGRGTWLDMIARRVLEREEKLGRHSKVLRTESGLGASGIPHIGSLGDVIRAYGVKLALETQGRKAEFIAYSDDLDGLRKVPTGMPESLSKYLGQPVSSIPDPYNCHPSYAVHVNSLLREAMDKCGVEYVFHSATEDYRKGLQIEQIRRILASAEQVGKIVKDQVGQDKYTEVLPYFPICESCGRIYTTKSKSFDPKTDHVVYACEGGAEIRGQEVVGCGYKGEVDIKQGRGKLPWKGEFAARWAALEINFEAYGKDITDSVRVNDRICEEILGYPPPFHVRYELFLDKGGKKISKSKSALEVISPQAWFKYGPPASLNLLMYKRITGARSIGIEDIPTFVNELDQLEEVYFGTREVRDEKERAKFKGLYEYSYFLKPPTTPRTRVSYNLLVYLVTVAPEEKRRGYVEEKLREYGYLKDGITKDIEEEMEWAAAWAKDCREIPETQIEVKGAEKLAIEDLITIVKKEQDARVIQNNIFNLAKKYDLNQSAFFKLLYNILLGTPRGPRLGPYIKAMGSENVANALERAVTQQSLSSGAVNKA